MTRPVPAVHAAIIEQLEAGETWRIKICETVAVAMGLTYDEVRMDYANLIAEGRIHNVVVDGYTGEVVGPAHDRSRPIRFVDRLT